MKEILLWDISHFIEIMEEKRKNQEVFKSLSCKNNLIIISGNLDNAYPFCSDITSYDLDADYYYNLSKRVNIINIKKALQDSFKDEHISRMGNNHIIFPTINYQGYTTIINRYLQGLADKVESEHGVKISFTENVKKM